MTENQNPADRRTVVAGADGSLNSVFAARWAAAEASSRNVPLTLAYALHLSAGTVPPEETGYTKRCRADGDELLAELADGLRERFPQLEIRTEVSDLSAPRTLIALSSQAGLVVTGTRGHGGFAGMLVGSVSRKLAVHTHCPLVVTRGELAEGLLDEVVIGVGPKPHEPAIRYAFAAAHRYGATLHAVRCWLPRAAYSGPMGSYYSDITEVREEELRAAEQLLAPHRASFPDVKVEIEAGRGNPVPLLLEAARETRLVVVGSHHPRGPLAVGAGYVIDGLLAHSPTPVAVVPMR